MRKRSVPALLLAALFIIIGSVSIGRTAYAAGVVSTCNEASLTAAVAGGGNVTFTCSGTIGLTSTITISSDTTIDGTGQNVTIDGGNSVQLFYVNTNMKLTLKNLTLTQGAAISGGAIFNDSNGILDITGCTFSHNNSTSGGGAIYSQGTSVTVTNSIFSNNSAQFGGAIKINDGTLDVTGSTFSDNNATTGYGGALDLDGGDVTVDTSSFFNNMASGGGAIDHDEGTLTITRSTFSQNEVSTDGGAIWNGNDVTLILGNSTFSENSGGYGGAIYSDFTTEITNCTLARNSASSSGGAIYVAFGTTTLTNTIVADSTSGGNCDVEEGTLTDGGNNLQFGGSVPNSCGATIPTPGSDPLGSNVLANNGGPTETIALPLGSAAIDTGVCIVGDPVDGIDQRGITRPQGPQCDIGAYEYNSSAAAIPTLTEWGMIIFMLLAGLGAVYYLRKQKRRA